MVLLVFALCGIPTLIIFGLLFALPIWGLGVFLQLFAREASLAFALKAVGDGDTGRRGRLARFAIRHTRHPGHRGGKGLGYLTECALTSIWAEGKTDEADRWVKWRKAHAAFVESGEPMTVTKKVWSVLGYRYDKEMENPEYERKVGCLHDHRFLGALEGPEPELALDLAMVERELAAYRRWKAGVRDYLRDPGAPLA